MPLDQVDVDALETNKEMSFLEHLEELRWHIIRSLGYIAVGAIALFIFQNWLFEKVIFGPTHSDFVSYKVICNLSHTLGLGDQMCFDQATFSKQAIGFAESFITSIKVCFVAGFVIAFPLVFREIWLFIKPGLYDKEQKATRGIIFICSILFICGVLFGYYVIAPFAINFLMGYTIPGVENIPTLKSFISYMIMFTLPAGLIFELPIVVYFLARVGLVTANGMRKYRRHSIIGILLLSALITPPDVVTQFLIGIPLYILYEASIAIAARLQKRYEAELRS